MTGRPDSFMPLYIGDYLADTSHLSTVEHGAYLLLIMHYWRTGKPLADVADVLARITKLPRSEWDAMGVTVRAFFTVTVTDTATVLTHSRVEMELQKAGEKYASRKAASDRANAAKRAAQEKQKNRDGDRDGDPHGSQPQPQPQPQSSYEDIPLPKGNGQASPADQTEGEKLSGNPPAVLPKTEGDKSDKSKSPDLWAEVYQRGKEILGQNAGGTITLLRHFYDQKPRKVLAKLEDAAEQRDPVPWINAFLWANVERLPPGSHVGPVARMP